MLQSNDPTPQTPAPATPPRTRRRRDSGTIAAKLLRAERAIDGTEANPAIIAAVETRGYPQARRAEGKALLSAAQTRLTQAGTARAVKTSATGDKEAVETAARRAYTDVAETIRAVFPARADREMLGLSSGVTPARVADFLRNADALFAGIAAAPAPLQATLAEFGYSAATLATEKAKISALHDALIAQQTAKGAAQNLTPAQWESLDLLDAWVSQYLKIARIALRNQPQLLEQLGVRVA